MLAVDGCLEFDCFDLFCFIKVDKLTANQKLDLNLERGRLRDDLQLLRDKLTTLRTSLEREVRRLHSTLRFPHCASYSSEYDVHRMHSTCGPVK